MLRYTLLAVAVLILPASACATDPPKVSDLVRQLETGTAGERVIAAERLGDLGPAAAEAIPALTRAAQAAQRGSKAADPVVRRANQYLYNAAVDALAHGGWLTAAQQATFESLASGL